MNGYLQLVQYATLAYKIKDRVVSSRLDAQVGGDATNSYVTATPEAMRQAVFAFMHPESLAAPTKELPAPGGAKHQPAR